MAHLAVCAISALVVFTLPYLPAGYAAPMRIKPELPKTILGLVLVLLTITAANADPVRYRLEADKSSVGFTYRFEGNPIMGTMPVASADIVIDFDRLAASKIRIDLDARNARAGFIFATEAMRGKSVLDAAMHPHIRFVSTAVTQTATGADIAGMIRIRGITKPATFTARFYR